MATVLKCKMCGGSISVNADMTVGTCQYCGSTMTLPRIDSDKKARLFNRANQYRINCEFDKAYDAYKMIANEDEQEAEAYWGMVLAECGVEYVEDPVTHNRIPTCHRTSDVSVLNNTNYKLACKYADIEGKMMYRDEAEEIDRIQKQILSISANEDPYDIFICYKETDDNGDRTEDSVIAQDLYTKFTDMGYKVFFSRITLENKLGSDFEPYIYAALKSSRIMLVVGTNSTNLSAVWVKNEWSRFISLMNKDNSKVLIPVFKGMGINEMPEELKRFQSQDLEKIGALQDLEHSVKKLLSANISSNTDSVVAELVRERNEEKDKKNKQKKKLLSVVKVLLTVLLIGIISVCVVLGLKKHNRDRELLEQEREAEEAALECQRWAEMIEEESIELKDFEEIPSSDQYLKMTVELTPENIEQVIGIGREIEDEYYLWVYVTSKMYEHGWIYKKSENSGGFSFDMWRGDLTLEIWSDRLENDDYLPYSGCYVEKNLYRIAPIKYDFRYKQPTYIVFYSKRALSNEDYYSTEEENGDTVFYRLTEWRDGTKEEKKIDQVYMTNHF